MTTEAPREVPPTSVSSWPVPTKVQWPLPTWTSSMPFTGMVVGPKAATRATRFRRSTVPLTPDRVATPCITNRMK